MTAMQIIASNVKEARKRQGLTQQDLSEKTGLMRQHIGKIESGNKSITIITLETLAKALELDIVELLKENHED